MLRIGIEINGVLRNTLGKIEQVYDKFYLTSTEGIDSTEFNYGKISELTTLEIRNHLNFESDNELFEFLYEEFPMEIFGHAQSTEYTTFNDLNDIYLKYRNEFDFLIVSDEIGKSKPASLFFLSKFGCLLEKIKFYSNLTIDNMWDEVDVLITSNPNLLLNHPKNKKVIKYETTYNKEIKVDDVITNLNELSLKIEKLKNYDV
jgi:hypothetical protein